VEGGIMSEILKKIKEDLTLAMRTEIHFNKNPDPDMRHFYEYAIAQKNVSRAIISMFPEIGVKPDKATDDDTIKLVKKFIAQQKERLLYTEKHLTEKDVENITPSNLKKLVKKKIYELELTSPEIEVATKYLPKQATEEEIKTWIQGNIDFSRFKNKIQAMGPIMKQFKGADGNFIKGILMSMK
jgi:hypothetical protein